MWPMKKLETLFKQKQEIKYGINRLFFLMYLFICLSIYFSVAVKISRLGRKNSPVVWSPLAYPPVFHKPSEPQDLILQLLSTQSYFTVSLPVASSFLFFFLLASHQRIEPSGFNTLMNVKRNTALRLILKKEPLTQKQDQFRLTSSSSLAVGVLALEKSPPPPLPLRRLICAVTLQQPASLFQLARTLMWDKNTIAHPIKRDFPSSFFPFRHNICM